MDIDRLTSFVAVQHQSLLHAQKSIGVKIDYTTQTWLADGMCAFVSQDHHISADVRLVALETSVGDLSSYYQRISSIVLTPDQKKTLVDKFQEEWLAVFNGRWCRLQAFGVEGEKPHAFKLCAKVLQAMYACKHSQSTDTDLEWNIQEALFQELNGASVHDRFLLEHTIDELCSQLKNISDKEPDAKDLVSKITSPQNIISRFKELSGISKAIQPMVLNNNFQTLKIEASTKDAFKP